MLHYITYSVFHLVTTCAVPDGNNTEMVESGLVINYLESYTYQCLSGYTSFDEMCAVCLENNVLSIPPPNCSGKFMFYLYLSLELKSAVRQQKVS